MTRARWHWLLGLLPLAGCAQTQTMDQLGFPVFGPVVGEETRYTALPVAQGLDGRPASGAVGDVHVAHVFPVPAGDEDTVFLAVGVEPAQGTTALATLAVAAYALHTESLAPFNRSGALPPGARPLSQAEAAVDDDGALRVLLRVPRDQLPPGAEHLGLPILVLYEDGWVQLRFFQTRIPEPYDLDADPPLEATQPEEQQGKGG